MTPTDEFKLPPQSIESEQALLGGIFIKYEDYINDLIINLPGKAFYRESHEIIYRTMLYLYDKGISINLETVASELKKKQELDKVGGIDYLVSLIESVSTSVAWEYHKNEIFNTYSKRKTISLCNEVTTTLFQTFSTNEDALEKLDKHIVDNYTISHKTNLTPIKEITSDAFKALEIASQSAGGITGLDTGFIDLNSYTAGFQPSDLIILAARPSMGKSSLALNIAYNISLKNKVTALFSLEMSNVQLVNRLISFDSGIDAKTITTGQLRDSDWTKVTHSASNLEDLPIYIDDSFKISITEMRSKLKQLSKYNNIDLVIIDYLQLMSGNKAESRQVEIAEYSREFKGIAKDFNVPVLCLSQLNRKVEERPNKRPILSDLRESGSIEQDADVVLFIYRDEVYYKPTDETRNVAEIKISKQRNGPTGTFKMTFQPELTQFRDCIEYYDEHEWQKRADIN